MVEALSASVARTGAPAFWRIWRADRLMRRKLTPAGFFVAAVAVAAAAFGLNTAETLVYQAFGLAVALLVVAALASLRLGARLAASRSLPTVATAGMPFEYPVTIRNLGPRAVQPLEIEEIMGVDRPRGADFAAYKVREDRSRNVFDRLVGYPRWTGFMRLRVGAQAPRGMTAMLAPGASTTLRLPCTPLRRGVIRFDGLSCGRTEPLGLMRALRRVRVQNTLLVMPRTYPAVPLTLPGSRRLQPGGVAFAGRVGDAEEFVSLRDYRSGDTPRRIHWKAWARTGRLVVKEYQDEFFVRHALLLDSFPVGDTAAFETAVSLAASLVAMPRSNESLLDLMFVEKRAYTLTRGRGVGDASELIRVLATVEASRGTFEDLAEAAMLHAGRISGALCVLLAWDEPRRRLVASLRGRGIPLRVWVVRDEADDTVVDPGPMASDVANFRVVDAKTVATELMRP